MLFEAKQKDATL